MRREENGLSSGLIAKQFGFSRRRIEQVWAYWCKHGEYLPLFKPGKKPVERDDERLRFLVMNAYEKLLSSASVLAKYLRDKRRVKISNGYVHSILLKEGLAMPNKNKQKRRKPWAEI